VKTTYREKTKLTGNFTQIPNGWRVLAPLLSVQERAIFTALWMECVGYGDEEKQLSKEELAFLSSMSRTGILRHLAGLEKKGLVTVRRNQYSRRKTPIREELLGGTAETYYGKYKNVYSVPAEVVAQIHSLSDVAHPRAMAWKLSENGSLWPLRSLVEAADKLRDGLPKKKRPVQSGPVSKKQPVQSGPHPVQSEPVQPVQSEPVKASQPVQSEPSIERNQKKKKTERKQQQQQGAVVAVAETSPKTKEGGTREPRILDFPDNGGLAAEAAEAFEAFNASKPNLGMSDITVTNPSLKMFRYLKEKQIEDVADYLRFLHARVCVRPGSQSWELENMCSPDIMSGRLIVRGTSGSYVREYREKIAARAAEKPKEPEEKFRSAEEGAAIARRWLRELHGRDGLEKYKYAGRNKL